MEELATQTLMQGKPVPYARDNSPWIRDMQAQWLRILLCFPGTCAAATRVPLLSIKAVRGAAPRYTEPIVAVIST